MYEKLLTIIVPAYNSDWCLEKCLNSLVTADINRIQIIIVNDGSTDNTPNIADDFATRYPNSIMAVHKENGGHGSCINEAVPLAKGKYLKVIDSDDWVIGLDKYLDALEDANADILLTHYTTVDMLDGERKEHKMQFVEFEKEYDLAEFSTLPKESFRCLTFHGITHKTETYRESGVKLLEKTFYEDQQYVIEPFSKTKTILPLDMFVYEYQIGNDSQSVSSQNQVKRIDQHEAIIMHILNYYIEKKAEISEGAQRIFQYKLAECLTDYYIIAMVKNPKKREGRRIAKSLRLRIAVQDNDIVMRTNRKFRIVQLMNLFRIPMKAFDAFRWTALYRFIRRFS